MRKLKMLMMAGASAWLTAAAPTSGYRVAESISGPDGAGWDYAAVDPQTHRLFVAHGDAVARFDLTKSGAYDAIGTIVHAHGVVPIPGRNLLLVTSGRDKSVRLIDSATGAERANLAVGDDPDAAVYESESGHVFVMNAHSGSISEIDPGRMHVVRTIAAKEGLEFAAIGRGRTLYVNDENANEIEIVDLAAGKLKGAIPLTGCEAPTGLAFDPDYNRLIAACANGKAAIVDAATARLVTLVDIGKGPDAVLIDAKRHVALIPCGRDGVLEILALDAAGVRRLSALKTEVGARTGAIDLSTGFVYLPTAAFDLPTKPGGRPTARPGTFHVVVVKPT
ncbi:MAG: YncE family protein [Sphingomonadales bacterium]